MEGSPKEVAGLREPRRRARDVQLPRAARQGAAFAARRAGHERDARDRAQAERQMARRAARVDSEAVQRQARRVDGEGSDLPRDIIGQAERDGLRGPRRRVGERLP